MNILTKILYTLKRFFLPFILFAVLISCKETPLQRADNDFDVSISRPAFTSNNPIVLFDEGHNNFHTTTGLYQPFANLIKNDGYHLETLNHPVTADRLSSTDIFIVANAKGRGDLNDTPAFSEEETEILKEWVSDGGSMLLIADHYPFGSAAQSLGDKFGIDFQKGVVEDSLNYDTQSNEFSHLEFSIENKLLAEHEITEGVRKVITFTGQSIKCKDSCFSFLNLSPTAFDLQARTKVTKDGNDTRVYVTYEDPSTAAGRSQGIALKFGKGRVVVLGEAAMLTAQKNRNDAKIGMNYNPDNKQLALNIVHWLTKRD